MKNTTYICDRCGKEKTHDASIDLKFPNKIVSDIRWITVFSGTGYKREMDLCGDCLKELAAWFNKE